MKKNKLLVLLLMIVCVVCFAFTACTPTNTTPDTGNNGGIITDGGGNENNGGSDDITDNNGDVGGNENNGSENVGGNENNGGGENVGDNENNGGGENVGGNENNGDNGDNGGNTGDVGNGGGDNNSGEQPETPETPETPEQPEQPEQPETPEQPEQPETPDEDDLKILVVYFSCTERTESVAYAIQTALNCDIYEIIAETPYTSADLNYNTDCRANREQNDPSARPAISGSVENMAQYDVVYIGYPIWWGQAPKIIYTFLESYDFSGKTIIPFCTSASSGMGSSATNLHSLASNAIWKDGARVAVSSGNTPTPTKSDIDRLIAQMQ